MPQKSIVKLHDKVLDFLLEWRKKNPGFTFALRKSDLGKKLSDGHWFFGTDELLIISFWSGMDWKGKIPNISFCYNIIDNESYVQMSVRDSPEKQKAIKEVFYGEFTPDFSEGGFYFKRSPFISSFNLLTNLKSFLENEKIVIDKLIKDNKRFFQTKQNARNRIGFITEEDFTKNLKRILKFKEAKKPKGLPVSLNSITIENFGPIKKVTIDDIQPSCQWIFLTGENGSGKTSILKAMATAFTNGTLKLNSKISIDTKYRISLGLSKYGGKPIVKKVSKRLSSRIQKPLTTGFVTFGPIRLNIADDVRTKNDSFENLDNPHLPLFSTTGFLLDIGTIYNSKSGLKTTIRRNEDRIRYIIEAIIRICDTLVDIHFGNNVIYFEADASGKLLNETGLPFKHLASGLKSIIALVSHMMIHLYNQQPNLDDPSELCGIVIIDEIDLHFHPKLQRDLVVKLTEVFPRVQFIASTHSPIPLLGAPANSVILKVNRTVNKGICVERLDTKVAFNLLLPNALLSSPIFGFDNIAPQQNNGNKIRLEDDYNQVEFNIKLENEINEFLNDSKEKELIALFKKSDK